MNIPNVFINCRISHKVKRRVMKKWIKRFVRYYRKPKNEFGFMVSSLARKWTYFPANIFFDDFGGWINIGNKKIILFQTNNEYFRDFDKIIPMTIEDEPQILVTNEKIDLSNDEIEQIRDFVRKCQTELIKITKDNDHRSFFEKVNKKGFFYGHKEEQP